MPHSRSLVRYDMCKTSGQNMSVHGSCRTAKSVTKMWWPNPAAVRSACRCSVRSRKSLDVLATMTSRR